MIMKNADAWEQQSKESCQYHLMSTKIPVASPDAKHV